MINIKMLSISVPGQPGQDYPILATVPSTSFSCADKIQGRSYADIDAFCQVYHTCSAGENLNNIQFSRLCPNGTIFDQRGRPAGGGTWWTANSPRSGITLWRKSSRRTLMMYRTHSPPLLLLYRRPLRQM